MPPPPLPAAAAPPVATHCPYCSLQCGITLDATSRPIVLDAQPDFPTNRGGLCAKGWTAAELFGQSLSEAMMPLRLLGVGAGRLTREGVVQGELFDDGERERQAALDKAVDAIRGQFGPSAIHRGNRLERAEEQ